MGTHQFENLISIVAIFAICMIAALVGEFSKQYPPKIINYVDVKRDVVQGYTRPNFEQRPQSANESGGSLDLLAGLSEQQKQTLNMRFEQAASLLHARQFEFAITALEEVVRIQPNMPEAYVNLGFAYLGLEEFDAAIQSFDRTLQLRRNQINAYYGMAVAFEGKKEFESALGSMRSYIHLAPPGDPYLPKARAAVWEWETQLGRNPSVESAENAADPHVAAPIRK